MVCPACHVGLSNGMVFDVQSVVLMDMCRKEPSFWNCFLTNLTMTRGILQKMEWSPTMIHMTCASRPFLGTTFSHNDFRSLHTHVYKYIENTYHLFIHVFTCVTCTYM